jgi:hypothetical protein
MEQIVPRAELEELTDKFRALFDTPETVLDEVRLYRTTVNMWYRPEDGSLPQLHHATLRAFQRRDWVTEVARGMDPEGEFYFDIEVTTKGLTALGVPQ